MGRTTSTALPVAYVTLRILIVLNWIYGACILALLLVTPNRDWIISALDLAPGPDAERTIWGLRAAATLGLVGVPINHAILTRLKVPAGATGQLPIRANATWLACTDKVCVPERGEFSLTLPTGGAATLDSRFNEWRRALPRPLASPARFAVRGDEIEIAVPLPSSVEVAKPYFFPADDGPINYAASQSFRRKGDLLIAELKRRRGSPNWTDARHKKEIPRQDSI